MAKQCEICGKKSILGGKWIKLMSKYNPSPKKRKYPNLQWAKVPIDIGRKAFKEFAGKRVLACTKCRRTIVKPLK